MNMRDIRNEEVWRDISDWVELFSSEGHVRERDLNMREVVPGPRRGKHPPNISDFSLPLSLAPIQTHKQTLTHTPAQTHPHTYTLTHRHTHTHTHTRTNRHSHPHTNAPAHRHSHTHTPNTSIQTHTPRQAPAHTDTLTDSTGSHPGRGGHCGQIRRQNYCFIKESARDIDNVWGRGN